MTLILSICIENWELVLIITKTIQSFICSLFIYLKTLIKWNILLKYENFASIYVILRMKTTNHYL